LSMVITLLEEVYQRRTLRPTHWLPVWRLL